MRPRGRLVLFFTAGLSLAEWDEIGSLEREAALYLRLASELGGVAFVTYGGPDELRYEDRLPGIRVLPNRFRLRRRAYQLLLPLLHGPTLARAAVLKTNQVEGGLAALRAKRLFRKPLVARCGYLRSEVVEREAGRASEAAARVRTAELRLFRGADRVVVTTDRIRAAVVERYGIEPEKVAVVPNYVDTERFRPAPEARAERAVCFVGRLSAEKNLSSLIEALAGLDGVSLTLVGGGYLRGELAALAAERGVDARFAGNLPNRELPALLNAHTVFVLPSFYEGHPKSLLEAMACGLPVVGADVPGIREVVRHGETGLLAGPAPAELRTAIEELLADEGLRDRVGRAARADVVERFSLERVLALERAVLEEARCRA